jgi:hypothetical protein
MAENVPQTAAATVSFADPEETEISDSEQEGQSTSQEYGRRVE